MRIILRGTLCLPARDERQLAKFLALPTIVSATKDAVGTVLSAVFSFGCRTWSYVGNAEAGTVYTNDGVPLPLTVPVRGFEEAVAIAKRTDSSLEVGQAPPRGVFMIPMVSQATKAFSGVDVGTVAPVAPQDLEGADELARASREAISDKIRLLISEGKPQDQAVAIALDMARRGDLGKAVEDACKAGAIPDMWTGWQP